MKEIYIGLLWGLGISIIGVPLIFFCYSKVKNTLERRKVKKMIMRGEFLVPIDGRDYDAEKWKNQIDVQGNKDKLEKLNELFIDKRLQVNNE
jgi:hypothetical protein